MAERQALEFLESPRNEKTEAPSSVIIRFRQYLSGKISMKLRVGIVGLGDTWENGHRPALRTLSDRFEVRCVCCEVAHLADQAARDFHVQPVDGFRALCARPDVDAVLILSPQWYGPLPILAACENGKSVYCGAALDIADPEEANLVKSKVEESGIAFMAEFPRRLAPATLRLKELI